MLDSLTIVRLYENVLFGEIYRHQIPEQAIRLAIESMAHVYKPDTVSLNSGRSMVADYNDIAHRCAYLHKYAGLHTAMVREMLLEAIYFDYNFFSTWAFSEPFKICSLGGGPGSDVIGALGALHSAFPFFPVAVTIVDYMSNWMFSFESILRELGGGMYGPFGQYMCHDMNWSYLAANLLKPLTPAVNDALADASLVTMIKFASAAACQDTQLMLKNIFAAMKPGAMVLFIDNDGGGFHNVFMEAALKYNFISVYGPHKHKEYINDLMNIKHFGYTSCHRTVVTLHIVQKPYFSINNGNYTGYIASPPLLSHMSPPTPMLFRPQLMVSPETPFYQPNSDFSRDVMPQDFISPTQDGPCSTPSGPCSTPSGPCIMPRKRKRRSNQKGCFPISRFRHHLAGKINQIKSRTRKVFKKKKNHPIFKL